jgi:hypothetical protein
MLYEDLLYFHRPLLAAATCQTPTVPCFSNVCDASYDVSFGDVYHLKKMMMMMIYACVFCFSSYLFYGGYLSTWTCSLFSYCRSI